MGSTEPNRSEALQLRSRSLIEAVSADMTLPILTVMIRVYYSKEFRI